MPPNGMTSTGSTRWCWNEEGIRIETAPGISQTIPMKDVKKHSPLSEEE